MGHLDAVLAIRRRTDGDVRGVTINLVGGVCALLASDPFPGCGRVAAHGGGLRRCGRHAEAERDEQGEEKDHPGSFPLGCERSAHGPVRKRLPE